MIVDALNRGVSPTVRSLGSVGQAYWVPWPTSLRGSSARPASFCKKTKAWR